MELRVILVRVVKVMFKAGHSLTILLLSQVILRLQMGGVNLVQSRIYKSQVTMETKDQPVNLLLSLTTLCKSSAGTNSCGRPLNTSIAPY